MKTKNIKEVILSVAEESLGFKSRKNQKWVRTWNDNLNGRIDRKEQTFKVYLQSKIMDHYVEHKTLRAKVRELSRKISWEDWNKFVTQWNTLSLDHKEEALECSEILKQQNDQFRINLIPKDGWEKHFDPYGRNTKPETAKKKITLSVDLQTQKEELRRS